MEKEYTSAGLRAMIEFNKETERNAFAHLRDVLDEPEPHRAYHLERLLAATNLCSDILKSRARLEFELRKAIQAGR